MMRCPTCKTDTLKPSYLEDMLPAHHCEHCGGDWLMLKDFLLWRERHAKISNEEVDIQEEVQDSKTALLCPVSGTVMFKYRISGDNPHRLDLSPAVHGVWLDRGEWLLLKKEGLAMSLNQIFTDPWQTKIKQQTARETFAAMYEQQFGEENYQRLQAFRQWLYEQDKKDAMLSYLFAQDPYSAS